VVVFKKMKAAMPRRTPKSLPTKSPHPVINTRPAGVIILIGTL
jgi:hypothetical protein